MEEVFTNIWNGIKDFIIDFINQVKDLFINLYEFVHGIFVSLFGETGGNLILMGIGFLILIIVLLKIMNRR